MSQELQLFLQALQEVTLGEDVDELKCELEVSFIVEQEEQIHHNKLNTLFLLHSNFS